MKKIKIFFAAATLCAAATVGYNAYKTATMTEQERLIQANLEALTYDLENGSGIIGECLSPWSSTCAIALGVELPGVFYML